MQAENKISKIPLPYRFRRYTLYVCVAIIALTMPFIQINGHQIFLLSFVHKELHLLGVVFSVQELYLMPFLLIMLFVGIFFVTSLGGRVWCGWACPQTVFRVIYRDGIETKLLGLRKHIHDKQKKPDFHKVSNQIKKLISIILFACIALVASANFLFFFVPPYEFFAYLSDPLEHRILFGFWLGIAAFLTLDVTFLGENFCIYACPYARVQSVLYDNDTIMAIYDPKRGGAVYAPNGTKNELAPKKQDPSNECTNCNHCVKVCPTHIDIRKGMQLECINCLECVDACTSVMAHYQRPSLVQWSSPNAVSTNSKVRYFRLKTIGYIVVLCVIFALLLVIGSKKESMLLNIDRNTQAYEIRKSGAVDNYYTFLIQNTDEEPHKFYFEILGDENLRILEPSEPVSVAGASNGKQLRKVIVAIRADKPHNVALEDEDKHQTITIRAFAVDDENITVERKTFFVYPSVRELSKNH